MNQSWGAAVASQSTESIDRAEASAAPAGRPAWMKGRSQPQSAPRDAAPTSNGKQPSPPPLPKTAANPAPVLAVAEKPPFVRPTTVAGWIAFFWHSLVEWWNGLYLGVGVTTSLILHGLIILVLALTFFSIQEENGRIIGGSFDEIQDGEELEEMLDSKLDTSFGDQAASLEFVATSAVSDLALMEATENLLGGADGDGEDAGDSTAAMARNIKVPESAITKGSFTVWTEPVDPRPRTAYDIVIQVQLPKSAKQYRLSDLSGSVRGTDGYLKLVKYPANERRAVKDGAVQVSIKIPGAAQLVKDVIQIRSKILNEEQTIEIIFGGKSKQSDSD